MTTEEVLYFYHYTSITAAKEIIMKGEIRPSEAACGDAAFGDGVYLTTLKPDLGITTIMNNNWGVPFPYSPQGCPVEVLFC